MRQNIDKSFKGMLVTNSKISMDLHSLPYGWNVTRTHEDFQALRTILMMKYPQTLLPGLPRYRTRIELDSKQLTTKSI